MKKVLGALVVYAAMIAVAGAELIVEVGDAITAGSFKYEDAKITVESSAANPRGSLEYRFDETPFAVGVEYASSENTFDGTYDDGSGTLDMERTEYAAYVRIGGKNSTNLRLGYRSFEYDVTKGDIKDGNQRYINGIANGDLSTGIDAELNLLFGEKITFGVGIGYTFFSDAEYTWEYDVVGGSQDVRGSAKLDAHSIRIRPEISFETVENLRIFVNYMLAATAWKGTPEGGKEYPGFDVFSAAIVGIRYSFGK